jgi:hypothetical protein
MTITSAPKAIQSHKDQPLELAAGVATGADVLTGSEDVLEVAAGVAAAAAGVLPLSGEEVAVTAGVVATAGVSDRLRG